MKRFKLCRIKYQQASHLLLPTLICSTLISIATAADEPAHSPKKQTVTAVSSEIPMLIAAPRTEEQAIREYSYMLGRMKALEFTTFDIYVEPVKYQEGLADSLQQKPSKFSDSAMDEHLQKMQMRLDQRAQKAQDEYTQMGIDLLASNAKAEGVQISKSGLQFKVLQPGSGNQFKDGNVILVDYSLETNAGQRIPLSPGANSPLKIQVGSTPIAGLDEALRLMSPGAVYEIKIPPSLAYGSRRVSGIQPDTVMSMKLTAISLLQEMGDMPLYIPAQKNP